MIRNIRKEDIGAICRIYNYYVLNTPVTFEEEEVSDEEMGSRIEQITKKHRWIVYEENNHVIGYAYAGTWRLRPAYRFSAEATIYLDHLHHGKGVGGKLYSSLITELKKTEIHSLIGGIALPNESSVAMHEKLGFVKCAHFKEVGRKFDKWIDVGYWEMIF